MPNLKNNLGVKSLYKVLITESARKQVRSLAKNEIPIIMDAMRSLTENPRSYQSKKLIGTADQYRLRKGDYRIIYTIDDHIKEVTVFRVRHRREAYR